MQNEQPPLLPPDEDPTTFGSSDFAVIQDTSSFGSIPSSSNQLAVEERAGKFIEAKEHRYRSDTFDRQWLAVWTAIIVTLWLIAVIRLLMSNYQQFHLSDMVLSVLLGTTTLNILGLSFIVLRGHFLTWTQEDDHK